MRVLAASLLNEIEAIDQPLVMVVDDFHRIDPSSAVNELIEQLIEHPWRLARLVIITRRDPPIRIPGLLAGAKLAEVRLEDLRFNDSETAELLAGATQTPVSEGTLHILQREVEGWAVGLRLTALALRLTEDPDTLVQRLGGGLGSPLAQPARRHGLDPRRQPGDEGGRHEVREARHPHRREGGGAEQPDHSGVHQVEHVLGDHAADDGQRQSQNLSQPRSFDHWPSTAQ